MRPRRRARSLLLTLGTLIAALVLVAIVQLRPPAWWRAVGTDATASNADVDRGERFEQACVSEIHRIRPQAEPWRVRIREEDVNAWLATRLAAWCDHVGIAPIGDVQVRFSDGRAEVGATTTGLPAIAVITIMPSVEGEWLQPNLGTLHLGRLPVPFLTRSTLASAIGSLGADAGEDLRAVLLPVLRGEGVATTFELADRRRVRLRDIELLEGELRLELETLAARPR